jgi:hypothetical protein
VLRGWVLKIGGVDGEFVGGRCGCTRCRSWRSTFLGGGLRGGVVGDVVLRRVLSFAVTMVQVGKREWMISRRRIYLQPIGVLEAQLDGTRTFPHGSIIRTNLTNTYMQPHISLTQTHHPSPYLRLQHETTKLKPPHYASGIAIPTLAHCPPSKSLVNSITSSPTV